MTKGKSKSKSRALVLSLVDSGGGGNNDDVGQPLPLDVYDPCSHSVTLRRSPRFRPLPSETHNVAPHNRKSRPKSGRDFKTRLRRSRRLNRSSGNGSLENSLSLVLDKRSLRRSPRLLGNGNAGVEKVVHVLVQDKCDNRKGKRVLSRNSEEKGIQKWSPRLASASSLTSLPGEFEMKSQSLKMKSQRNERQSMIVRLYCTEEQTKGCWKESQQNVPAEFESKQLSLTWHEHDDKETLPISCYISTVCNSGQPSKRNKFHPENYDLEMVDDNFWRQASRISNSASGAVNENLNRSSIELPKSAKKKPLMNSGRQCLSEKINLLALKEKQNKHIALLIGDPVPSDEAQDRWRWRYDHKSQRSNRPRPALGDVDEDKIVWNVECHYTQAEIDGSVLNLGDCVYVKGEGEQRHIGRIVEFFKTTDGEDYFRIQWFYRAEDTVMKDESAFHDKKRLFYSTIMNDNPIDCIISKATVVQTSSRIRAKSRLVSACDFYFDMEYCLDYSTFRTLPMGMYFVAGICTNLLVEFSMLQVKKRARISMIQKIYVETDNTVGNTIYSSMLCLHHYL